MSEQTLSSGRAQQTSRLAVLGVLAVVGALAIATIVLIAMPRLSNTTASNGQDMSDLNRGLIGSGFGSTSPAQTASGQGPVADIAVGLVARAFSFTSADFDKQVAAAEATMTVSMKQKYTQTLKQEQTQQAIALGLTVTTSLMHLNNDPKQVGFVGVRSLTATKGEFVMYMQRQTTTAGSNQAQATAFLLDVTVVKIGNTWVLSDVGTI